MQRQPQQQGLPNTLYLPSLMPAVEGLLRRGVASERIEAVFQRSLNDIRAPFVRVPMLMSRRFWALALETSGDLGIGLELGRDLLSSQTNGLSWLFDAETSLRGGFEHLVRYLPVFHGHFQAEIVTRGDEVQLRLHDCGSLKTTPQMVDYVMSGICALVRRKLLASGLTSWPIRQLSFAHAAPVAEARYVKALHSPVSWEQPWHALHFDRELFTRPLTRRDEPMVAMMQGLLEDIRAKSRPTLLAQVCNQIAQELPDGPTLESFCDRQHMTRRTARRRLQAQGWHYSELLDEFRRYRAGDLLLGSSLSLAEVTDLLGYNDQSSFSRAFNRWYGSSPGGWRVRSPMASPLLLKTLTP